MFQLKNWGDCNKDTQVKVKHKVLEVVLYQSLESFFRFGIFLINISSYWSFETFSRSTRKLVWEVALSFSFSSKLSIKKTSVKEEKTFAQSPSRSG